MHVHTLHGRCMSVASSQTHLENWEKGLITLGLCAELAYYVTSHLHEITCTQLLLMMAV